MSENELRVMTGSRYARRFEVSQGVRSLDPSLFYPWLPVRSRNFGDSVSKLLLLKVSSRYPEDTDLTAGLTAEGGGGWGDGQSSRSFLLFDDSGTICPSHESLCLAWPTSFDSALSAWSVSRLSPLDC